MSEIRIQSVDSLEDYRSVEELQKEVWQFDERDIVPIAHLVAAKETGGILLGAYRESRMVGFVYGFVGLEEGSPAIHSHMLAVAPDSQGQNLGFVLKRAQRDQALRQGIDLVTWTFDPLQSLNAYLNIVKLGVIAVAYRVNFYGQTSSTLHRGIGTDRLWVRWELDSERVEDRIAGKDLPLLTFEETEALVEGDLHGEPSLKNVDVMSGCPVSIQVPGNIGELQASAPELAVAWREATRAAFCRAFDAGYYVTDFRVLPGPAGSHGTYFLSRS